MNINRLLVLIFQFFLISCSEIEPLDCFQIPKDREYNIQKKDNRYIVELLSDSGTVEDSVAIVDCKLQGLRKIIDNETNQIIYCNYLNDTLHGFCSQKNTTNNHVFSGKYIRGKKRGDGLKMTPMGQFTNISFTTWMVELLTEKVFPL